MSEPRRLGTHPLDDELADKPMLAWMGPAFALMLKWFMLLVPGVAAFMILVAVFDGLELNHLEGFTGTVVTFPFQAASAGIILWTYCRLAAREGGPWGVGATANPRKLPRSADTP